MQVRAARANPAETAHRWPFELLQNAHDPGPRADRRSVCIHLTFDGSQLVFKHDGQVFTMEDLAALLSGGSSKDIESEETTGRFGTGFLVTHVLSHQIDLNGLLDNQGTIEQFSLHLDRSGDEAAIMENADLAQTRIADAAPIGDIGDQYTAQFIYSVDQPDAARNGIESFLKALPYLYATCRHLGTVSIQSDDQVCHEWSLKSRKSTALADIAFDDCLIQACRSDDATPREYRVLAFHTIDDTSTHLLLLLAREGESWRFVPPDVGFPRLFFTFPIRRSTFVPINAVINARFDVEQERDDVQMSEEDRSLISRSLRLLPHAWSVGHGEGWESEHLLLYSSSPSRTFGTESADDERGWWNGVLRDVTRTFAASSAVKTAHGYRCCLPNDTENEENADLILPRYSIDSADEVQHERLCQLAKATKGICPPVPDVAADWVRISDGWAALGVKVNRLGLMELAAHVRKDGQKLDEFPVAIDPREWIATFFDTVGSLSEEHNRTKLIQDLVPSQAGLLKSPGELARDGGINPALKDIASDIGVRVRDELLDLKLESLGERADLPNLRSLLETEIERVRSEEQVLGACIESVSEQLGDGHKILPDDESLIGASIRLLEFLWSSRGNEGTEHARRVPLRMRDNSIAYWSQQKCPMAPVESWHEDAREFAEIYSPARVLHSCYARDIEDGSTLAEALVAWGMAIPDPLINDKPRELKEERLRHLLLSDADITDCVLRDVTLSQIALLPSEVIQRCEDSEQLAKKLFGMAIQYIARHDDNWRQEKTVKGAWPEGDRDLMIHGALWLSDLRHRAWVPMKSGSNTQKVSATAGSLEHLLEPAWLVDNDKGVECLVRWFGFNNLDLRLASAAPDEDARLALRDRLANLVQVIGSDPFAYDALAAEITARRKREAERQRNRRFGLAVQEAVRRYLDSKGLVTDVHDHGYDYDVSVPEDASLDAGTHHLSVGPYKLEIKATTTGEVRLTPAQAGTAVREPDRFVLCVVDLRDLSVHELDRDWSVEDVESRARIITRIDKPVGETHGMIEAAAHTVIPIRNQNLLRYCVAPDIWTAGSTIARWVELIAPHL